MALKVVLRLHFQAVHPIRMNTYCDMSADSPAELTLALLGELTALMIPWVYLRGYEKLPKDIGNDVDLLIPAGMRNRVADIFVEVARRHGWKELYRAPFGPLAQYFFQPETTETVHLDIFDRLEWHFLEYADASGVLARRRFNGLVHVPDESDEVVLNVLGRLLYHGIIRPQHRRQALGFSGGHDRLRMRFVEHLGPTGGILADRLAQCEWQASKHARPLAQRSAWFRHGLCRPLRPISGMARYLGRSLSKLANPPGKWIVVAGCPGSGKSTLIETLAPWASTWSAGKKAHLSDAVANPLLSPGGSPGLTRLACLRSAARQLGRCWARRIFRIHPLLAKSYPVIEEGCPCETLFYQSNPAMKLPAWLLRLMAALSPKPDLVIGLIPQPDKLRSRNPKLTQNAIADFDCRWQEMSHNRASWLKVQADGSPEEVAMDARRAILNYLCDHFRKG